MKVNKKVIGNLNKCYSIAPLRWNDKDYILVAAEKQDPCYLFDLEGNKVDTVWEGPGGVMTMCQVPGSNGVFLATYKFYSPNDGMDAKIIICAPTGGKWEMRTLVDLPCVHRFDILTSEGKDYLIACTLKTSHEGKEDWSQPGKIWVAELPKDLSGFNDDNQLKMEVLEEGLLKNHGYSRVSENGQMKSIVTYDGGVFKITPPAVGQDWKSEKILDAQISDASYVDMDGDGKNELCTFTPFHGDDVVIYHMEDDGYKEVYRFPEPFEFSHAIMAADIGGKPTWVAGHRKGKRGLNAFRYDGDKKDYTFDIIDEGAGPANVFCHKYQGKDVIIATNRETDEIARYEIEE